MNRQVVTGLLAAMIALLLLSACAGKKDLRYRDSVESTPLTIPAGLDTPRYNRSMEIPLVQRIRTPGEDEDIDIEKPPSLESGLRVRDASRIINDGNN